MSIVERKDIVKVVIKNTSPTPSSRIAGTKGLLINSPMQAKGNVAPLTNTQIINIQNLRQQYSWGPRRIAHAFGIKRNRVERILGLYKTHSYGNTGGIRVYRNWKALEEIRRGKL